MLRDAVNFKVFYLSRKVTILMSSYLWYYRKLKLKDKCLCDWRPCDVIYMLLDCFLFMFAKACVFQLDFWREDDSITNWVFINVCERERNTVPCSKIY